MTSLLTIAWITWSCLRTQWSWVLGRSRADERGSVVEVVIITALFATLALTVCGIIVAKVLSKAHSITLN